MEFLINLPNENVQMKTIAWKNENIPISQLDDLSKTSFPLCMRSLHESLRRDHKLRYYGRQQYGLFLKGIGVTLEGSLEFWKTEFLQHPEIDEEIFYKRYAYHVRHNYGREGSRINYKPLPCNKIINSDVGPGENHGCPYKHMDLDILDKKLSELNIYRADVKEITKLASEKHYKLACGKCFESIHKEPLTDSVTYPNVYFAESRKLHRKENCSSSRDIEDLILPEHLRKLLQNQISSPPG